MTSNGLIHIYCGDGKGKTTASLGLSIRAAGRGQNVLIVRFLKTDDTGELPSLARIPNIEVTPCDRSFGFTFQMDEETMVEAKRYYRNRFQTASEKANSGGYDLLILDEIMSAYNYDMVEKEEVIQFLKNKPKELEVVLTGRDPARELLGLADYVSEIRKIKHPFEQGIPAREGIEY